MGLLLANKSAREAASILNDERGLNINHVTISRWKKTFDQEKIVETKRKGVVRRPKSIGEDTGKKILDKVKNDRNLTAVDIHEDSEVNHKNVSYNTINRFITDNGFIAR